MNMSLLYIAGVCAGAGIYYFSRRGRAAQIKSRRPSPGKKPVMMELRSRVLAGSATEFAINPQGIVWGMLMEMGMGGGAASLIALADGNASLYFSTGGAIIGGIDHPGVRSAAVKLCELGNRIAAAALPTNSYPLPDQGSVRFYVLTTSGVKGLEALEKPLGEGKHTLSPLFMAGQDVITELRLVSGGSGR